MPLPTDWNHHWSVFIQGEVMFSKPAFSKLASAVAFALVVSLPAFAATPVNVNKADATTIAKALDGVGQAKAVAIVAYRDEHGPFKSAAELTQVKGIGQSIIDRNHDAILLSGATPAASAKSTAPAHARHKKSSKAAATAAAAS
jgi:competence protein ComEA